MKKLIALASLLVFFGGIFVAHATVGGPMLVSDLKYNPADTSVYYTVHDFGGKGCPPYVKKLSLSSGEISTVLSCDQLFQLSEDEQFGERLGVLTPLKDLTQIDLGKNQIAIEVVYERPEYLDVDNFLIKSHFMVNVRQQNVLVAQFPVTGCNSDQSFLFGGYAVPGLNKKMILLISAKNNCWEGGYTYETLQPINATILNRDPDTLTTKKNIALTQSAGTLTIFDPNYQPRDVVLTDTTQISPTPSPQSSSEGDTKNIIIVAIIAAAFLLIGVVLGRLVQK